MKRGDVWPALHFRLTEYCLMGIDLQAQMGNSLAVNAQEVAACGEQLIRFLDANLGLGADWPIRMDCDDDVADELIERLNALREAVGITLPDHSALYRRPPALA